MTTKAQQANKKLLTTQPLSIQGKQKSTFEARAKKIARESIKRNRAIFDYLADH